MKRYYEMILSGAVGSALTLFLLILSGTSYPIIGGAPVNSAYLVSAVDATLTNETDHDGSAAIHGLGASINVMGSRVGANVTHQSEDFNPIAMGTSDSVRYITNQSFSFATAYSAAPDCIIAGSTDDASLQAAVCMKVTTTAYDFYGATSTSALNLANLRIATLGTP